VAVIGVSDKGDAVGHIVVDNLREAMLAEGDLVIVKPGQERFLGLPTVPDVGALAAAPVDLLLVALPAAAAVATLEALIDQGGGAKVVGLVAGGIGDGADRRDLGARVRDLLDRARAAGRWTPAVLGPNFLGHVVPGARLSSTFIARSRWPPPELSGPLALVSQSGAFILSRLARARELPLGLALALGNQLDVHLAHVLEGLLGERELRAVAAYVEGFGPGELEATARAAQRLSDVGVAVVLHRAGKTDAGQLAAASHTGALAGDLMLEAALLGRAGVRLAPTIAAFDAALTWLAHDPSFAGGPVAVVSNAGFEAVSGADGLERPEGRIPSARLRNEETQALAAVLRGHGLGGIASPLLPLDLTPMADLAAYRDAVLLLLDSEARVVVVGLVPFTLRLDLAALPAFAAELGAVAASRGKTLALVMDAQPDAALRAALALPVFSRMEDALAGLRVLARSPQSAGR
jgi:acyl-CoA synthetase (NDP forming)